MVFGVQGFGGFPQYGLNLVLDGWLVVSSSACFRDRSDCKVLIRMMLIC